MPACVHFHYITSDKLCCCWCINFCTVDECCFVQCSASCTQPNNEHRSLNALSFSPHLPLSLLLMWFVRRCTLFIYSLYLVINFVAACIDANSLAFFKFILSTCTLCAERWNWSRIIEFRIRLPQSVDHMAFHFQTNRTPAPWLFKITFFPFIRRFHRSLCSKRSYSIDAYHKKINRALEWIYLFCHSSFFSLSFSSSSGIANATNPKRNKNPYEHH